MGTSTDKIKHNDDSNKNQNMNDNIIQELKKIISFWINLKSKIYIMISLEQIILLVIFMILKINKK